jgi:hypothetical protein
MSKKMYLTLITIVILIVASVTAFYLLSSPQKMTSPVTVGVKVGDVFTYKLVGIADSYTEFDIPANFVDVNKTDYYRIEITKVHAPIVSYTETWQFINGTKFSYDNMVNLENGLYANSNNFWPIYASGLTEGDLSRPGNPEEPVVSTTQLEPYPGGDREINFIRYEYDLYDPTDMTYTKTCYVNEYVRFDSQTGMVVEYNIMQIYNSPQVMLKVEHTLVDSNVIKIS